jgi:DNA-binding NtrC family response regulator
MNVVLIVEDERRLREGLVKAVSAEGYETRAAGGVTEALEIIGREEIACILLDIRLKDGNGLDFLRVLRNQRKLDIPVIVTTAYGDSERTIQAMRDGAFEYLTKPFDLPVLLATLDRALKRRAIARDLPPPVDARSESGRLIGTSAPMLAVWKVIGRAAASDAPVLITGETGTGKELVARAIHQHSVRAKEPFVVVDVASLPGPRLEVELFGSEGEGRIQMVASGTLFLDHVGDLNAHLQAMLFRLMQEGPPERPSGAQSIPRRARIIAASSKPVRPGDAETTLREDLFYTLAVIGIEVPPLRQRRSDIPLLVAHALMGKKARALTEEAMDSLAGYSWPGNVRELMHVIERAAVMCGGEVIGVEELPETLFDREKATVDEEPEILREAVARAERRAIIRALEKAGSNRSEAARRLGIARTHLYVKMQELGITGPAEKDRSGGEEDA